MYHIPNEIHQTTAFPALIVPDLLGKYRERFRLRIYSDAEARDFIARHYGQRAGDAFEFLPGPNRGDMFRYAVLGVLGGASG